MLISSNLHLVSPFGPVDMNAQSQSCQRNALATGRWMLWIDLAGGYLLLEGERFSIGGGSDHDAADLPLRWGLPKRTALIERGQEEDALQYTQQEMASGGRPTQHSHCDRAGRPLRHGEHFSAGIAAVPKPPLLDAGPQLEYRRPSPLSQSAALRVLPPHRWDGPADAAILVRQTVLLGPEPFNHIRVTKLSSLGIVLFRSQGEWVIRGRDRAAEPLIPDRTLRWDDWTLTLSTIDRGNENALFEKKG